MGRLRGLRRLSDVRALEARPPEKPLTFEEQQLSDRRNRSFGQNRVETDIEMEMSEYNEQLG